MARQRTSTTDTANPTIPPVVAASAKRTPRAAGSETSLTDSAVTISWTQAIGVSGLKRPPWRGQVYEEFLRELTGQRGAKIYREMRDNDAVVGAVMFSFESLIRAVDWRVEEGSDSNRQFVEECLSDMRPSFASTISEILSMNTYGWSLHEVLYKVRRGYQLDARLSSQFNDGRLGWQGWPGRSQDSLQEWVWDENGNVVAMVQQCAPHFNSVEIPLNRCLHFTTTSAKQNPEGRSLLRSAYRSWYYRRNIQNIEAIGIERDLAGMPVIERDEKFQALDASFDRLLTSIRRDEREGVVMPLSYDDKGNKLIELKLLSAAGPRQANAGEIIERYSREIAMALLADFIMMGHESVGSFALSDNKTQMFARAVRVILENITTVINEEAIPRLFAVNGLPLTDLPKLGYGDIETPDLQKLGDYVSKLAASGCPLWPDPQLESYVRSAASMPQKSEEAVTLQEEERQYQAEMQTMQLESMRQQAGQNEPQQNASGNRPPQTQNEG